MHGYLTLYTYMSKTDKNRDANQADSNSIFHVKTNRPMAARGSGGVHVLGGDNESQVCAHACAD